MTSRLGQIIDAETICSGAPLERDPFFPKFRHIGNSLRISQPLEADGEGLQAQSVVVLLPGMSRSNDLEGWNLTRGCHTALVCLASDNTSKMMGINLGFIPVATVKNDTNCVLPTGGWSSGDKERTASSTSWRFGHVGCPKLRP